MKARFRSLDPATWPGPRHPAREVARFRSSWSSTIDLLDRELDHLRARDVVIEAAFRERDIRLDGLPRADAAVPSFPGIIVSFGTRDLGPLRYLTDRYRNWQDNVRAIALSLEALRAVDRYGVSSRGEQYRGWSALPPGRPMGAAMTVEDAARLLDIDPSDVEDDVVRRAYRRSAKDLHPDAGGDPEEFRRLTEARDLLLEALR